MQDYNNLSNKSKELREYRKAYVKKTIRKHALEILGGHSAIFCNNNIFLCGTRFNICKNSKKTRCLPLSQEELVQNGITSPSDYADFLNEYLERQKCSSYILELVNTNIAKCFPEYKEKIEYDRFHYICSKLETE